MQSLLKADYLDILYDNRNKSYGGYELRSKYPDRAKRAIYAVLLMAGMLSSIPVIAGILGRAKPDKKVVNFTQTTTVVHSDLPKEKPPVKPILKQAEAASITATVAIHVLKIVPTDQVTDDAPKPIDSLGNRTAGLNNNDGNPNGLVADNGQLDGNGPVPTDPPPPVDLPVKKPLVLVSQMPEFDGDVSDYLIKHLVYPEQARMADQEGRAVVKFVVNEDGGISDPEIVVSAKSKALDKEALRVVSAMPKWKPGKQQGELVKVYFNLPISFKLN